MLDVLWDFGTVCDLWEPMHLTAWLLMWVGWIVLLWPEREAEP